VQKAIRFGKLKDPARQINRRKVTFFFFVLFCFALFVAVVDLPCVFFNSVSYKPLRTYMVVESPT